MSDPSLETRPWKEGDPVPEGYRHVTYETWTQLLMRALSFDIRALQQAYYAGRPVVSDYEFDQKFRQLQ